MFVFKTAVVGAGTMGGEIAQTLAAADLPVVLPGRDPAAAPAYRGDRLELRLGPEAAARARTVAPVAPAATRLSRLGAEGVDRLAARWGVWFEPEFAGETPPPEGSREPDFTAYYLAHLPPGVALEEALTRIGRLRERAQRVGVKGSRVYNPGWHLALDLFTMLTVSEAVAMSALMREESRGGHTRDDFPKPDPEWGRKNVIVRRREGHLVLGPEPLPVVPSELRPLIGEDKPTGKVALEPVAAAGAKE